MTDIWDLTLEGCSPVPLAHYLKALGIHRIVAEQFDHRARCYWKEDEFHIISRLDRGSLVESFLERYTPSPVVAPWNGASGFYYQEEKLKEKDPLTGKKIKTGRRIQPTAATKAVDAIMSSKAPQLAVYREVLGATKQIVSEMRLEAPPEKEAKEDIIQAVRNRLSDAALAWLDAAVVLTADKAKYPPLLGTGGNDGNTEFSSNFMQRLIDVIDLDDGRAKQTSRIWLGGALFGTNLNCLKRSVAIGQFLPAAVGGANAEASFSSDSLVNPWDFILMIEGTLFFAAATVKRLLTNEPGFLSFPFSVRASGVGYGSASGDDEKTARAEIWVPLWGRPASAEELMVLMSEGRAQIGRRFAKNGVDFARAVSSLGVDRGLSSFQRYGFHVRNGKAYFATPLGRFQVRRQPQVDLLNEIDSWISTFRERAASEKAPASAGQSLRKLDEAIFALCKEQETGWTRYRVQEVLIALGECEQSLAARSRWARDTFIRPVTALSERWVREADDESIEFRLALSLASVSGYYKDEKGQLVIMSLRRQMEPVKSWIRDGHIESAFDELPGRDVTWHGGDLIRAMNSIMKRRIMRAEQSDLKMYPDFGRINADLGDVSDFIEGRVDLKRIEKLLWGLILLDWPSISDDLVRHRSWANSATPAATYGIIKLCFAGRDIREVEIPLVPEIHRLASIGDSFQATQLAARRLRGSGLEPAILGARLSKELAQRMAAALLFPLSEIKLELLADRVLRPNPESYVDKEIKVRSV